ncbi:helix-turn-helix transcriptional regulator [Ramlibacter pallidus]|uniref:Helix-turn-helix transcriptional regulator n=1 Tax=Ramlibacter pallidus TaxID=2780087 RepID=A0ABR9S0Y9_9BURK|nr:helix-turn-helix transcriptional regulator [Ramlibacter pallidus]MBE7367176.1 helix-turn-helix transcriptional regulator [Ramlibacter pallidus]
MLITRQLCASDGSTHVERIRAAPHGADWGPLHEATQWRCVLPGHGHVYWRNAREFVYVDALTAFRLSPGDTYQLQHRGTRDHHVLYSGTRQVVASTGRAWLLRPRELFEVKRALAQLRRGEIDVASAGAAARSAVERAASLQVAEPSLPVLRARQSVASAGARHLDVQALAEEARCSPFHLAHLFRRHLGTSPHQYRLHLRIADALQRLEDGGTRLADLAFDLGFSSQSHFGQAFRQAVGCTPRQARTALR